MLEVSYMVNWKQNRDWISSKIHLSSSSISSASETKDRANLQGETLNEYSVSSLIYPPVVINKIHRKSPNNNNFIQLLAECRKTSNNCKWRSNYSIKHVYTKAFEFSSRAGRPFNDRDPPPTHRTRVYNCCNNSSREISSTANLILDSGKSY